MTIFELVARERARVTRLVHLETSLRAAVVVLVALTLGALLLGGARWIALPRLLPFAVWAVAIGLAAFVIREGARRLLGVAAPGAIAEAVEQEQHLRRGAVRGVVELAHDTSVFVRYAAHQLSAQVASVGSVLAPALERRMWRRALIGAGALVPVVLAAAFLASRRPDGWRALAHPVDAWRGTLLSRLEIAGAPKRALRGSTLHVTVRANGRAAVALRRRATGNAWIETALNVSSDSATAEFGPLDADLTLVASDGRAESDTVIVRVVDRPFVGDVAVRVAYPAYLHRQDEALPSDVAIRVPRGSELTIEGHASEALASVALVNGADSIPLDAADRRFTGHFKPESSASWLWSASGKTTAIADVPAPLVVEVVADSAPAALILQPAKDSLVLPSEKVELQLLASDDHGLQAVTLRTWRVARDGKRVAPTVQKLAGGGIPDWAGIVRLDLAPFALNAGDAVHVQLTARDETPWGQEGKSRELVLRVPAADEQRATARAAADSAAARAMAAVKAQENLEKRTNDAAKAKQTPADKDKPNALKYENAEQAKALGSEQKDMANRVEKLQEAAKTLEQQLKEAGVTDTALLTQLRDAQRMLKEALTPDMLNALKKLDSSTKNLNAEQSKASLEQLAEQQKKMKEALEKSAEMLKRAALEGAMQTLKDEAKELAKQERALADSGEKNAPGQSKRLQDRVDQLAKDIEALKERMKKSGADAAQDDLDKALSQARQAKGALDKDAEQGDEGKPQAKAGAQKSGGGQQKQGDEKAGQKGQGAEGAQSSESKSSGQMAADADQSAAGPEGKQGGKAGAQGGQQGHSSSASVEAAERMELTAESLTGARKAQVEWWKQELTGELDQNIQEMTQFAAMQDALAAKAKQNPNDANLRGEQSALQQGMQKAQQRLADEAKRSALVSQGSQRAVSQAGQKVDQAARDAADGRSTAQTAGSMTDAASAIRQAAAALARDRERAGAAKSATGLSEMIQQIKSLSESQNSVNGQMQDLLKQAGGAGREGLSSDARDRARGLARTERDLARQLDDVGDGDASGRAAELAREARQVAESMDQASVDPGVLERQQRLFRRMLDAGRALQNDQKDSSGKRESKPGDQKNPYLPPNGKVSGRAAVRYRVPEWNELRGLNAEERRLVIDYFRRLNGDKP